MRDELKMEDIPAGVRESVQTLRDMLASNDAGWAALCNIMHTLAARPAMQHRCVTNEEQQPGNGMQAGLCISCGTDWPCKASLIAARSQGVPEGWTDQQCLEFACVAFRRAPGILPKGVTLKDIRLGAQRAASYHSDDCPPDPAPVAVPAPDDAQVSGEAVTWARNTEYGRVYNFAEELVAAFPNLLSSAQHPPTDVQPHDPRTNGSTEPCDAKDGEYPCACGAWHDKPTGAQVVTEGERSELERLRSLVNSPELHDFARGAVLEAAHQVERWGTEHDSGKTPADWFWLVGYLAGKALHAHASGDTEKALHHTISTAAALANWHRAINGANDMRPGIDGTAALYPTKEASHE